MIVLRKGCKADAPFIATMIMMALHIDMEDNERLYNHMIDLVEDDGTLYFYSRCIIASSEGEDVGLCLSYDACDYHERRIRSFSMPCRDGRPVSEGNSSLLEQEDEAEEGEYYIDSLAVVDSYRHKGIGRELLAYAVEEGRRLCLRPTLLVDPANDNALRLYTSLGFKYERDMFAFGQVYHKYGIC